MKYRTGGKGKKKKTAQSSDKENSRKLTDGEKSLKSAFSFFFRIAVHGNK